MSCFRRCSGGVSGSYETVHTNLISVLAPLADVPVTVIVLVPCLVPVPLIRPDGLIVRPAGRPVAE